MGCSTGATTRSAPDIICPKEGGNTRLPAEPPSPCTAALRPLFKATRGSPPSIIGKGLEAAGLADLKPADEFAAPNSCNSSRPASRLNSALVSNNASIPSSDNAIAGKGGTNALRTYELLLRLIACGGGGTS